MLLSFDSTGFHHPDQRTWVHPGTGDQVVLEFFDLVPDLPAALEDQPKLRHELAVITGRDGCLIEAEVVGLGGVAALVRVLKLPLPDQPTGQVFVGAITVPKAMCSATLRIVAPERGMTGVREATLMARLGPRNWILPHPYAPGFTGRLPYHAGDNPHWDGQFPDHPLSRVRAWLHHALRTAVIDPGFAALPPFRPAPVAPAPPPPASPVSHTAPSVPRAQPTPVPPGGPAPAVGSRLTTVAAGLPVGGHLPLWLDNRTVVYWRLAEPDRALARLGSGTTGRMPLQDDWRRDMLMLDLDNAALFVTDRYQREDGGIGMEQVPGHPVDQDTADAAATSETVIAAFRWIGEVFGRTAARNEYLLVGPGGTELYGRPRVLLSVESAGGNTFTSLSACPIPAGAPFWKDLLDPNAETTPDSSQVINGKDATPESIRMGGVLAGFAAERWNVRVTQLSLSFKERAPGGA